MCCQGAERPRTIPAAEVDQSVITTLSLPGTAIPRVISHIDLTEPLGTVAQWTLVVVQEGGQPPTQIEDHGPILVCLVKATTPDCDQHFYQDRSGEPSWFDTPYHLLASSIVYAGRNRSRPLLLVKVCTAESFNGNCGIATALYGYDRQANRFVRVFLNVTGRNNNQDTRFVESGPIQGDVVVGYPTGHAPYSYWIEVYQPDKTGHYIQILRYRGSTGYNDGNPLAVPDSEMPAILRHLGLWHPGDPLPVPLNLPKGCSRLFLRHGEEWCK